jgi:4-hydroxy-3-polyprenylbenzoate decarboxylase
MRCGAAPVDRRDYTGATGAIYGVRLLEALRGLGGVESHLLISSAGWLDIQH